MHGRGRWMGRLGLVGLVAGLCGCGPRAVYIQGGQGSSASMDISVATGTGKVMLTGPFVYCENEVPKKAKTPADLEGCPTLQPAPGK